MTSDSLLILVGAIAVLATFKAQAKSGPSFARKRFLTDNEARLLDLLEASLPHHRIMAQVAMGALLTAQESDKRRAHATRNRFTQKIVDFAVVTRDTAEVVALIELDDRTHRADKDRKRNAMTAAAGYRRIRIAGRPKPTAESVRTAVADLSTRGDAQHGV